MGRRKKGSVVETLRWAISVCLVAASVVFAACSSAEPDPRKTYANGNSNIGAAAEVDPTVPARSNGAPKNTGTGLRTANDVMTGRRRMAEVAEPPTSNLPPAMPAPENSAVVTTMDKDGSVTETRTFDADNDISSVIRVTNGWNRSTVIYLKSGKPVSIPPASFEVLNTVSLALLKELAGVKASTKLSSNVRHTKSQGDRKP